MSNEPGNGVAKKNDNSNGAGGSKQREIQWLHGHLWNKAKWMRLAPRADKAPIKIMQAINSVSMACIHCEFEN
jgi:hypothetical protein